MLIWFSGRWNIEKRKKFCGNAGILKDVTDRGGKRKKRKSANKEERDMRWRGLL